VVLEHSHTPAHPPLHDSLGWGGTASLED